MEELQNVLLVSSATTGISELLKTDKSFKVTVAASGSEARRILLENFFELVIINAPLSDEFGHDLALGIAVSCPSGVILAVKNENADEISEKVEDFGVFVLPKPISRQFFFQALKLVISSRRRVQTLQKENKTLHKNLQEIKLVDLAKCALIQYKDYTESEAHRYIEKTAMDKRISKTAVAREILDELED